MDSPISIDVRHAAQRDMAAEARSLVDEARARGQTLRLLGGLAVRRHCAAPEFCERDYSDIDVAGRRSERKQLTALFRELGYEENVHVEQATRGRQLQFHRPCRHCGTAACLHDDDHVDVFLDSFKMDHEIALGDRLAFDPYTLSLTDTLLTKLQVFKPGEKDLRDILTLLKDVEVGENEPSGEISATSIARRCATDWGLYHDVERSLARCAVAVREFGLDEAERARIGRRLERLHEALEAAPKSLGWRLRARVGERRAWHNVVEEQGEDDL